MYAIGKGGCKSLEATGIYVCVPSLYKWYTICIHHSSTIVCLCLGCLHDLFKKICICTYEYMHLFLYWDPWINIRMGKFSPFVCAHMLVDVLCVYALCFFSKGKWRPSGTLEDHKSREFCIHTSDLFLFCARRMCCFIAGCLVRSCCLCVC